MRPHLAQCSLHNAPKLDLVDLIKVTGESAGDFAVEDKALARAKRARDSQQFGLLSLNVSIGHSASSPPRTPRRLAGAAAALFVGPSDDRRFVVPVLVVFVLIGRAIRAKSRRSIERVCEFIDRRLCRLLAEGPPATEQRRELFLKVLKLKSKADARLAADRGKAPPQTEEADYYRHAPTNYRGAALMHRLGFFSKRDQQRAALSLCLAAEIENLAASRRNGP